MSFLGAFHVIVSTCLIFFAFSYDDPQNDAFQRFNAYIQKFNKTYEVGTMEFKKRESIFEQTLHRVEWLNKQRYPYTQSAIYGINQFSDLTPEEFKKYVHLSNVNSTFKKPSPDKNKVLKSKNILDGLPKKVDWRSHNVITPVNNQEQCGACWAFSMVETIESMYALKKGALEQWSVQQMLDCATKPNDGCEGGDICAAIEWLYENKIKLVLAKDYPFAAVSGACKNIRSEKTAQIASNFTCDSFVDEESLMLLHLAYHGPLVAAVDASGWQDYLGGIIQFHCDGERNHAVQIVGYDMTGDVPFYIVRNSWGTKFGNAGYLYIVIGKNMCRIAEEVSSVDVI